ncbi:MAG: P-loop NTPase fold protein [Salinivirgaceae bacterium]
MKAIKHHELLPDKDNPFLNCKLGREPYADVLTNLVTNYADGFVLAINNPWGTGKTTFVKMWEQKLKNLEFKTLYFNAWENDFEPDVLVTLISELKDLQDTKSKKLFRELLKNAAPLGKKLALSAAKSLVDKYIGEGLSKEATSAISEVAVDGLESELNTYLDRKKSTISFKDSLAKFVEKSTDDKPVIFIIDELDRCRPNYAVEVLEQIKHLFSVPKIVFVLSIDKEQLGHAVRGVYGSEKLNADEYLRRFIDVEYSIPEPNPSDSFDYLFAYFGFEKYFVIKKTGQKEYDQFKSFTNAFFKLKKTSMRNQEKIFAQVKLALSIIGPNFSYPSVLVFLTYLKLSNLAFYGAIKNLELTLQQLLNRVERIVQIDVEQDAPDSYIEMIAQLLVLYKNYYMRIDSSVNLFEYITIDNTNKKNFTLKPKIKSKYYKLDKMVDHFIGLGEYDNISLDYLFSKIDLKERFKS